MVEIITIGLDIAKSVFQVHGVDASENAVTLHLTLFRPAGRRTNVER